jgi:hypothetical protein
MAFRLFGDAACRVQTFSSTNAVTLAASAASDDFTPAVPGTYWWTAAYSGDHNNAPAHTPCSAVQLGDDHGHRSLPDIDDVHHVDHLDDASADHDVDVHHVDDLDDPAADHNHLDDHVDDLDHAAGNHDLDDTGEERATDYPGDARRSQVR